MSLAEFNVLTMLCDFLTTEYLMRKDGRPSAETLKVDDYLDNKVLVDEKAIFCHCGSPADHCLFQTRRRDPAKRNWRQKHEREKGVARCGLKSRLL